MAIFFPHFLLFFTHLYLMERLTIMHADKVRAQILTYLEADNEEIQYLLRLNAMLLLSQPEGMSASEIADMYGLARQTVTRWAARLNKSQNGDISVLRDTAKPGRDTRMSTKQIAAVDKALTASPRKAGVKKDKWTGAVLSQYLKDRYGVELKIRMCQRWIRRLEDARKKKPG